jgi:peptidoglycan/xylan/chitin deacetylase (PgdA/CDA1 family)
MLKRIVQNLIPRSIVTRRLRRCSRETILLTFDDGPDPETTPRVLEQLAEYNATAVFFVVGKAAEDTPELIEEIIRQGHLVGNHTHSHRVEWFSPNPSPKFTEFREDVAKCTELLSRICSKDITLFRPPGGRITASIVSAARTQHLRCVTWSKEVSDWAFRTADEGRVGGVALSATLRHRDIVLLHDNNPIVINVLDALLPRLRRRGVDLSSGVQFL